MYTRIESSNQTLYKLLSLIVVIAVLLYGLPQLAMAAGGSYSISFYASDPAVNKGSYQPTYEKLTPYELPKYLPGRGDNVLKHAVLYGHSGASSDRDGVTSLEPSDLALGTIVVFQVEIDVTGSTESENGRIKFTAGWNTHAVNGSNFGFDPAYGVYSAFVDYGDKGSIDPGNNATVDSYSTTVVNQGTKDEQIQGTFTVSGLEQGDRAIVEIWMVLKTSLPDKANSNVHTGMISASTYPVEGNGETINVGVQNVPLNKIGSFYDVTADIAVTKSDDPDPVYAGGRLTYNISVTNTSTAYVANGIVARDTFDPRLTFVSADKGGTLSGNTVTWPMMALSPQETVVLQLVVDVPYSIADVWSGIAADTRGNASTAALDPAADLVNNVALEFMITKDNNAVNNQWQEPTNVLFRTTDITVNKTWDDSFNNQENYFGLRPASIQAQLLRNGQPYGDVFSITAAEGWQKPFTGLSLKDANGNDYTYTVQEIDPHKAYNVSSSGLTITNVLRRVDKEATKIWQDFDDEFGYRPDSVRVKLLRDGVATGMEADLTSTNSWKYTFTGLPEKDATGRAYVYSIEEITTPDRYTKSEVGMTVTNTLITGEIAVNKLEGSATDLTGKTFYVKLTKADDTTKSWVKSFAVDVPAIFEDLPYGTYNIEEVADMQGTALGALFIYNVTVGNTSLTINANNPEQSTNITNTVKTGSITISKMAAPGTTISDTPFFVKLSSVDDPTNSWVKSFMTGAGNEAVFTGLNLGAYTYEEVADMQGTALTNTFRYNVSYSDTRLEITPQALNDSGSVTNQVKTGTVTINKLAGEDTELGDAQTFYALLKSTTTSYQEIKPMTTSEPAVFTSVPLGSYTVEEVADAQGTALPTNFRYSVTVSEETIDVAPDALDSSVDITNTIRRTEVSGQKIWQDQDNAFDLRPEGITVYLYQNDDSEPYDSQYITDENVDENNGNIWNFTFDELPMFDENNEAYTYSVSEPFVSPDYMSDANGMNITNTLYTTGIQLLKLSTGPEVIPLADATFELWRALPQQEEQQIVALDVEIIPGTLIPGMRLETLTTDDEGEAETEGSYPQGMYYLIETTAPFGYYPLSEPVMVYLMSETIRQLEGEPFELTIYNNFIFEPDISILKTVANLTAGTAQGESAELLAGEVAGYEVTVTNEGNARLDQVLLYDSEAYEGLIATDQDGIEYTFELDSSDEAFITLGAMDPEQVFILTYEYTTVEADADRSPIINTAAAEGTIFAPEIMPASEFYYNPFPEGWFKRVEDTAEITVELPPEETTTETTPEETTTETIPVITVITETIPLAPPPTIQPITESVPLATPPTISVVTEQIPQSGENPPIWPLGLALLVIAAGLGFILHKPDNGKRRQDDK